MLKGHVAVSINEDEDSTWAGDYIKIKMIDGNHFDCKIKDIIVRNGAISDFDCQYAGIQQVFI